MNRALLLLLSLAVLAHAQVSPGVSVTEFQHDDVSLVLRTLARQGNFEIKIASNISGTVTLRADDKTPREVFDMIAATKHLVVNERDGILYVRTDRSAPITVLVLALAVAALFVWFRFFCVAPTPFPKMTATPNPYERCQVRV